MQPALLLLFFLPGAPSVQAGDQESPYSPPIAAASNEGQQAIAGYAFPKEFRMELFAAEPMLANPVAFHIDERGRIYVCETFRQQKGVEDNRHHMSWLDDDLAAMTVEDRLAYFKKHLGDKVNEYAREHDRIRLLEDRNGDGRADTSTVFADGFNHILDGTGAGVLARRGDVYYTCIPKLYRLRDNNGDGQADVRQALHHGYGVRVAFRGHDMHGLRFGPDGRLYFSIGDRGFNVEHEGKRHVHPDTGAVLRCNPDGSDLEVFAIGLRNPQELAFDDYGNLFTCDNNSDSGDQARWVYVVEGGDSGWRMSYQYFTDRGPWNREKLWHPHHEGQPAWIVPPVANLSDGPSGLAYYPGTGMPERYKGHFFLCDFRGTPGNSGIRSLAVEPKGAGFNVVDSQQFCWSVLATDVDFGPDGMYLSDWVDGWNGPGKGRIYRLFDPQQIASPAALEARQLIAEGFTQRPLAELAKLLAHADQRVRQEAQFALAERGAKAIETLVKIAKKDENQLARLHGIWGLGQIARQDATAAAAIVDLLDDATADAEVRCQIAKVVGDAAGSLSEEQARRAVVELGTMLESSEPRMQYFACLALSKLGRREALPLVIDLLRTNADRDPYVRHAGVMALTALSDAIQLVSMSSDASPAVRLGALLALRRHQSPLIAPFLNDPAPAIVDEAARAINDAPINEAMPQLAALLSRPGLSESAAWRALNANFRLGGPEHAAAVAAYAARGDAPEKLRLEALQQLADWAKPSARDRVMGLWRPLEPRAVGIAAAALTPEIAGVFNGSDELRKTAAGVASKLGIKQIGPLLFSLAADRAGGAEARVEAIKALAHLQDPRLPEVIELALADSAAEVRAAGRDLLAQQRPGEAIPQLAKAIETGEVVEKQAALATLAKMPQPAADELLQQCLDRLLAGDAAAEIELDILEAAKQKNSSFQQKLQQYEAQRPQNDPLAKYRETLVGGNAQRGREIFLERASLSCLRCHKVQGAGGEVGPDLSKVAAEKKREYLLESIVDPSRTIARGFETVVLTTVDGQAVIGILKSEDDMELRLMTAEGKLVTVAKAEIDERGRGKSAMPETLLNYLTRSDLRDLVEYLSTLK